MKTAKMKYKFLAGFLAFALALILGAGFPAIPAYAASGNVYTCTITPCYRHPVTGEIEDSGGESSYATGQGMVEGAIYTSGIMEVTEDGNYYLTIRMSLIDYTSGHSFWVQNVGDSGWSTPAVGITANGTDSNGTTADICIQVPSENCVVRGSMYVEPMERDVIFYLYPSDYSEGNSTDMVSTMITTGTDTQSSDSTQTASGGSSEASQSAASLLSTGSDLLQSSDSSENESDSDTQETQNSETDDTSEESEEASALQSSITKPATVDTTQSTEDKDTDLNSARGLSLSTEGESDAAENERTSANSIGQQIFVLVISITIAGLILLAVGAVIVYYFRKNWYRWGGGEDDE